jgi:hypothetical protein
VVAVSLRRAINSWIDKNPNDFVKLFSKEDEITYHAEKLFDTVMSLPDLSNRRDTLWPLCMCLALFCPETLTFAVRAILNDSRSKREFNYARVSKKIIFFDNVRQCLRIDGLCEIAAICMTDLAKAIYLLPKDQGELVGYVISTEKEVYNLIFDPNSRLYKQNKDRTRLSQLVLDKLIAVYRHDKKEFMDISVNKAYQASANTYITFNMAKFCREFYRRTHIQLRFDDFGELALLVAPRIRRLLQSLLQSWVPTTTSASPDRQASAKGAGPVEKSDLIVEILRLYGSCIDVALQGTRLDDKVGTGDESIYAETAILDYIIEESVGSKNSEIAEAGTDFVESLYAPENAWRWTKYARLNLDEGHLFWQYTYPLTFVMAQKVINTNIERDVALQSMQRLHSCYNNLLRILRQDKVLFPCGRAYCRNLFAKGRFPQRA